MIRPIEIKIKKQTIFWWGSITVEQVESLRETFATYTPQGWIFPRWLEELATKVAARDLQKGNSNAST